MAELVMDELPRSYAILKEDGSLNNGFEMVTRPDSLAVHSRILSDVIPNLPSGLRSWDPGTCGIHIHVSRKPLSQLQQGKMLVFINHPDNKGFVEAVAGRDTSHWASISPKKHAEAKLTRSPQRYSAINLSANTMEFRIFRGTVKYRHIIRNIEFVDAICDFSLPNWRSIQDAMDYRKFIAFCAENRKFYPIFSEWAEHMGVIKPRKLRPGASPPEVEEAGFIKGKDL
jgi:hypothetical protein